jgi:hypothetical protein
VVGHNMIRLILFSIVCLLVTSCDNNPMAPDLSFLSISLEETPDENGYYHLTYTGTSYHSVYYQTMPEERVYWTSPDEFSISWNGFEFEQPIISYSTYADEWGSGQQLFYMGEEHIGDTLMVFGYVNAIAWDYLYFIIDVPSMCPCLDYWQPMCGVDGNTYSNGCYLDCAGIEFDYNGECE